MTQMTQINWRNWRNWRLNSSAELNEPPIEEEARFKTFHYQPGSGAPALVAARLVPRDGAGRCHHTGLHACLERPTDLGRRRAFDQASAAITGRAGANLDRTGSRAAILPPGSQCFLGGVPALGRFAIGLPFGQHPVAHAFRTAPGRDSSQSGSAGSLAGRSLIRASSSASRVRGVDFGTQEHAVGCLLSRRRPGLYQVHSTTEMDSLGDRNRSFHAWADVQVRDRDSSGGIAGHPLVETWNVVLERGCSAADSLLCFVHAVRALYCMDGTKVYWREWSGVQLFSG